MKSLNWLLQKRHIVYVIAIAASATVLAADGLGLRPAGAQAANSLYLSPASGTYTTGANFTVAVRVNTSGDINAVGADMTYGPNLQYVSIDSNGSAFSIDASSTGGNGLVSISRATITPVSGDQLVAKVTFKALSAGTGVVTMAGSSQALSSSTNQNVLAARNGGSYSIMTPTTPVAPTSATPTPLAPATPSAGTTRGGTPTATTSLPKTTIATQGNPTTTPLPGDSTVELSEPATVETSAEGGREIAKVEYLLNGKVVSTDTAPPYAHNIDTKSMRNGTYSLTSKTYYVDGKTDTSKVSLVVNNPFGLKQLWLQLKHYAWLIIILLIIAGELVYLKFIRGRKPSGRQGFNSPLPSAFGGTPTPSAPSAPNANMGSVPFSPPTQVISPTPNAPAVKDDGTTASEPTVITPTQNK